MKRSLKTRYSILTFLTFIPLLLAASSFSGSQIIVDHDCTKLTQVPETWITQAKSNLHIAYGHTSHGSQLTTGMTGLVGFTGGYGGSQFAWNNGGTGGGLDLHDYAMDGDCGYYPQWVNNTRTYLNTPANSDVNVIIWSWCGQHAGYTQQQMIDQYLAPMAQLELDYPGVRFVYMTGHLDYAQRTNTSARNQQIRDYCRTNGKILYDFADIESYDPDGMYYPYATDGCDYYSDEVYTYVGNWADNWQNSHVKDVEWYECSSAHSKSLNANLKAYAAWWLWARLAGWEGLTALTRDNSLLSTQSGGTVNFTLDAGATRAGRSFFLLGSLSGTSPGYPFPGSQAILPLNRDNCTDMIVALANHSLFKNFMGTLDGQGEATAILDLGPVHSAFAGYSMHFAFVLYDYQPIDYVSNPISVKFVP